MFDFLFHHDNALFTAALGLMGAISLLEVISTFLGFGFSGLSDQQAPDIDLSPDVATDIHVAVETDAEASLSGGVRTGADGIEVPETSATPMFAKVLSWFHVGRVPVLILLVLFLFGFGVCGLLIQSVAVKMMGWFLSWVLASIPAFAAALGLVRISGRFLASLIPKDETDAVSEDDFIGRVAQITLGTARRGVPAQAKLHDAHGHAHYVMIEPEDDHVVLETGAEVLVVRKMGAIFAAIPNLHKVLAQSSR